MDLTPKVFRDVQFREKLRGGYHPEDVDEFLEQAALAVEGLQDQMRQAVERAQRAEQAASEASATDDTLKRMLVIAQRTADEAVREAREEADRVLADARSRAESLVREAEDRGRKSYEAALAEGRASLSRADEELRQAQQEVEAIKGWVDSHKAHLLGTLRDAQAMVERAGYLSEPPATPAGAGSSRGGRPAVKDVTPSGSGPSAGEAAVGGRPETPTGEWDPRLLEELDQGPGGQAEPEGLERAEMPPGPDRNGWANDDRTLGQTVQIEPSEPGHRGPAAAPDTIAFDERALDSFFSDQELGDERGLGRFRRRQ